VNIFIHGAFVVNLINLCDPKNNEYKRRALLCRCSGLSDTASSRPLQQYESSSHTPHGVAAIRLFTDLWRALTAAAVHTRHRHFHGSPRTRSLQLRGSSDTSG